MDSPATSQPSLSAPSPDPVAPRGNIASVRHKDQLLGSVSSAAATAPLPAAAGSSIAVRPETMESIAVPPFRASADPQEGRGKLPGNLSRPELSIVMPAYNEDAVIAEVVTAWLQELERLGIDYEFLVYDD